MGPRRTKGAAALALGLTALLLVPAAEAAYDAQITRTKYGVPHIKAQSIEDLGFGIGYAFAEDNICTMADTYVTVRAQRSRFFGPNESWVFSGNGARYNNLASDFYFGRIKKQGLVEDLMSEPPPEGPLPFVRKGVRGYVAGYNAYLRETGVENIPDPRCRGQEWVRPITEIDAYRRFFQLGILASSGAAIDGIANAAPVLPISAAERRQEQALDDLEGGRAEDFFPLDSGSNAYGLGSEATANGLGMVLGNPHFPWDGAERLYQMHLTIPGKVDVSGAGLYGVPLVLIGHTRGLAWSHTVASAWRFTPYELTINPLDSHQYLLDGEFVDMKPTTVRVMARNAEGDLEPRTRTLYDTEFGPMFDSLLGLELFPWTPVKAFALKDVNFQNFRYLNHFAKNNMAQSVGQYDRIQDRFQGIPWVNSIAADRRGRAYYSMDGAIPNVPDSKASPLGCGGALGAVLFPLTGIPVLDGTRTACDWNDDPTAVAPDIFGPGQIPELIRRDYVTNGNDSHWLTNPEQPLTGFNRVIGDEGTVRSLRTRLGLRIVQERLAGTDGLKGKRFRLRQLAKVALNNRQYAGELWRDDLVAYCQGQPALVSAGACAALAEWDGRNELDSRGAILFQRFVQNLLSGFVGLPTGTSSSNYTGFELAFTTPFSAGDPVNTPRGLNTLLPQVGQALQDAVADLQAAGIPLDAPLRKWQYEERAGKRIPIHGGSGEYGLFNAIGSTWDPDAGYSDIPHGTSFIAAMQFRKRGCPARALTFVSYSQSENPRSKHATDYTRAFSREKWNRVPFCADEVRTAALDRYRVSGG